MNKLAKIKKTQSIWNLIRNHRTDQKLAALGQEMKGIVVRQGLTPYTITVRSWWQNYNYKYKKYNKRGNNYQVNDAENFCRVGDVVVIKYCKKLSSTKSYYVRNVISQAPRNDHWDKLSPEVLRKSKEKLYVTQNEEKKS